MHNILLNISNFSHAAYNFDQKTTTNLHFSGRRCGTRKCHLEPAGSSEVKKHQLNRTLTVKCFLTDPDKGQDGLFQGRLIINTQSEQELITGSVFWPEFESIQLTINGSLLTQKHIKAVIGSNPLFADLEIENYQLTEFSFAIENLSPPTQITVLFNNFQIHSARKRPINHLRAIDANLLHRH